MFGFVGKILRVNLSSGRISEEELKESDGRKYLGARGLASKILFEENEKGINPFHPNNKLIFMTGPLSGTPVPGSGRHIVVTKSAMTEGYGEANSGGFFGPMMKFAGFDGIIFEGAAPKPVYLWAHDQKYEIREASHLKGKTTMDTLGSVREEIGEKRASVASIGPGSENLVRFGCIVNDLSDASGRNGVGAVMASKNLKAVAVHGKRQVPIASKEKFSSLARELHAKVVKECKGMTDYGTAGRAAAFSEWGMLPTKNFQMGSFEGVLKISGETMTDTILTGKRTCYACPVQCKRIVRVKEGEFAGDFDDGPEYETIASLGSLLLNEDLSSIAYGNYLCNANSIDTISTGAVIAFAMECYENGLLTKKDTGGLELKWGDPHVIIQLIEMIVKRQGIGDLLAEGAMRAAKKIGKGSERFAMQVKGLEMGMHEPRGKKSIGLNFATANRGAVHNEGAHDPSFAAGTKMPEIGLDKKFDRLSLEWKAELAKKTQDLWSSINALILCRFPMEPSASPTTITDLVNLVAYTTGWDYTVEEFMQTGERIYNLGRLYNVREGMSRKDDTLPERFADPMPGNNPTSGQSLNARDLNKMLDEYYELRGWDKEAGIPTDSKVEELGLGWTKKMK